MRIPRNKDAPHHCSHIDGFMLGSCNKALREKAVVHTLGVVVLDEPSPLLLGVIVNVPRPGAYVSRR